jgi:hypothetical protein
LCCFVIARFSSCDLKGDYDNPLALTSEVKPCKTASIIKSSIFGCSCVLN